MASMTKQRKTECQVILILLVVALLLQEIDKKAGDENAKNPAVEQCTQMIDGLLRRQDDATRAAMIKRIDAHRIKLTKRIGLLDTASGLIGSLRLLTGGYVRSSPGTRLHYIISTFHGNLSNMEQLIPFKEDDADTVQRELKVAVAKVGGKYSKSK